jgi:hypothetical protein
VALSVGIRNQPRLLLFTQMSPKFPSDADTKLFMCFRVICVPECAKQKHVFHSFIHFAKAKNFALLYTYSFAWAWAIMTNIYTLFLVGFFLPDQTTFIAKNILERSKTIKKTNDG